MLRSDSTVRSVSAYRNIWENCTGWCDFFKLYYRTAQYQNLNRQLGTRWIGRKHAILNHLVECSWQDFVRLVFCKFRVMTSHQATLELALLVFDIPSMANPWRSSTDYLCKKMRLICRLNCGLNEIKIKICLVITLLVWLRQYRLFDIKWMNEYHQSWW